MDILNKIESIEIKKPSDIVLERIRQLIIDGLLKSGDRLPPERALAEKFTVGRIHVREAIKKLEFYGIVKTFPQHGTIVSDHGISLLENMISNIIKLEKNDQDALMEARDIMEINAIRLAAQRISDDQLKQLKNILDTQMKNIENGESGINEDLVFHLKMAEFSNNSILNSMCMLIIPQVHKLSEQYQSCNKERSIKAHNEHTEIYEALRLKNARKAVAKMELHLQNSKQSYSK